MTFNVSWTAVFVTADNDSSSGSTLKAARTIPQSKNDGTKSNAIGIAVTWGLAIKMFLKSVSKTKPISKPKNKKYK